MGRSFGLAIAVFLLGACGLTGPRAAERTEVEPDPAFDPAEGPMLRLNGSAAGEPWWEAFAFSQEGGDVCVWTIGQNAGNGGSCGPIPDADLVVANVSTDPMHDVLVVSGVMAPGTRRAELHFRGGAMEVNLRSLDDLAPGLTGFAMPVPLDVEPRRLLALAHDGSVVGRFEFGAPRNGLDGGPVPTPAGPTPEAP